MEEGCFTPLFWTGISLACAGPVSVRFAAGCAAGCISTVRENSQSCGALWRAKSTHSSGSLSRKSITLTIGKCAMSRQMLKCCKWLCGSNNCVELSVSDEYSTECLFCKFI